MKETNAPMKPLNVPVHSGDLFAWEGREGAAFASDLTANGGRLMGRFYRDSTDECFWIRSSRTGDQKLFFFTATEKYGEKSALVLESIDGILVRVYND